MKLLKIYYISLQHQQQQQGQQHNKVFSSLAISISPPGSSSVSQQSTCKGMAVIHNDKSDGENNGFCLFLGQSSIDHSTNRDTLIRARDILVYSNSGYYFKEVYTNPCSYNYDLAYPFQGIIKNRRIEYPKAIKITRGKLSNDEECPPSWFNQNEPNNQVPMALLQLHYTQIHEKAFPWLPKYFTLWIYFV